jgi:hypothetical protein
MAGKSKGISVNEGAVEALIEEKEEQVRNSNQIEEDDDSDMTGGILRPKSGVVNSSEMSNTKPNHIKDNVQIVRDSVVAPEPRKVNDGTVNLPSKVETGEPMVSVKIKKYARFKYGRNYYELYPGDIAKIPEGAKENLKKTGCLEVS